MDPVTPPNTPNRADPLILYCLMRTDLASMTPGKGVAQGMHAANRLVRQIERGPKPGLMELLREWENEAQDFGTVLTVDAGRIETIRRLVDLADQMPLLAAGIVHDPTYPLVDGKVVHHIPLDTCGYIFGRKSLAGLFTREFPLLWPNSL